MIVSQQKILATSSLQGGPKNMMSPQGDVPKLRQLETAAGAAAGGLQDRVFQTAQAIVTFLSLTIACAAIPVTTFSQVAADPQRNTYELAEIVVTARKVSENVQDIPMSVQVLTAEYLDAADITRLYELQFSVPGLVVQNLGLNGASLALRGIANQGGTSVSVATHMNGVYLGTSNLALARMFDLERIEVLKGPQGTLYGRNATGGSINFITRAPEMHASAGIEAAYGSFDTARIQGHVNLPFDRSTFRLAFTGSEGDGYISNSIDDRQFGEEDYWGLRGSFRADLTENLRMDLVVQHVTDDGASGELWGPHPTNLVDPNDIRLTTVTLEDPYLIAENDSASLTVDYDIGFASLYSITGYARSNVQDLDDCAGTPELQGCVRGVRPTIDEQLSQEFRLAANGATTIDWLIGAYFFDADESTNFHFTRPLISPQPLNNNSSASDTTSNAIFGQATYLVSDGWSITGGLRLSSEERQVSSIGTGRDDHPTLTTAEDDWDDTSWRIDVEYAPNDNVLAYVGVSTGFKSGGITTTVLPTGEFNSFDAEDLIAYEAGIKTQWAEQQLTLNGAAFYYDFEDLQISSTYFFDGGVITEVENAAKAEIYGVDVAGSFHLSDRFTASGGVVWMPKRELIEFESERRQDNLAGNVLSRAPEWSVTTALDYDHPLQEHGRISTRLEYNYRSDFFYNIENDPLIAQDNFGLLNVLLRFEPATENWYVFASARNLTNEDYYNQVFLQSSPGYPDTYELGFGLQF